jgi:hypothetical protein
MRATPRFTKPVIAFVLTMTLALGFLISPLRASAGATTHMALALGWKGYADTKLKFSQFFSQPHTLFLRFMCQFPNAYEGPMVAENGAGRFVIGQGDFRSGVWGPKLYLAVGSNATTFSANLKAGTWYNLAVAATGTGSHRLFTVYLDGAKLGTLNAVASDPQWPSGKLRFGKRTTGQLVEGRDGQFYGFLDDVAVFDRALSAAEVQGLSSKVQLSGNEDALLAGYTFNKGSLPAKLKRSTTVQGSARSMVVSGARNNGTDATLLPLPDQNTEMTLPFPAGEAWNVIQGCDDAGGTHNSYGAFCWDFGLADQPQGGAYPYGSSGAPFYAAAPGDVVTSNESGGPGEANAPNIVEIQQAPGEIAGYLHLRRFGSFVSAGETVTRHQKLALTGDTGAHVGAFHLHFATTDQTDGTPGFVTYPIAFSNYEVRDAAGNWKRVVRGMPKAGEVIRKPLDPTARYNAVWRPGTTREIKVEGVAYDAYRAAYDKLWPQGWRLYSLQPYANGSQVLYNAIWRPGTTGETHIYGASYEEYRSTYDELWPQGWRLFLLEPYVVDGQVLYTAVWRPGTTGEKQVYGWSYEDFRKEYDKLWPQGWRLYTLKCYVFDGHVCYDAIWRPSTTGETQAYEWSYADYRARYDELWPQGWRVYDLQSYVLDGQLVYTAVWRPGTTGEKQAYDVSFEEYQKLDDELRSQGWGLYLLDAYQP